MPVRVGFLGAGLVARIHRASLSAVADHIVWAGVYDTDVTRAGPFAEETGARLCRTETELFDCVDAVYICTWTSEHPRLVRDAVDRGLAVYCEKPLAVSLSSARAMTEHVIRTDTVHQTGLVLRHSPAFTLLRCLITNSKSGPIMSISLRDDQYLPVDGYYASTWRSDPSRAGSGVLLEHSIHALDILEYLVGPIRQVSCQTQCVRGISGIEDEATALFSFTNGVSGTLTTVWHDMLERPNERRVEVFCRNLWCVLDGNHHSGSVSWQWSGEARQTAEGKDLLPLLAPSTIADFNPDAAFILAVEQAREAYPDFRVGLRAHELVDAAYRSAEADGTVIQLNQ